jgi:hypothetical protein
MNEIKWQEVAEKSRTYIFRGGNEIRFTDVTRIEVRDSGKHRIECKDGRKAFVNSCWLWLEIVADAWTF